MEHHVCPWWMGYFLLNPLRRMRNDPVKILTPHVQEGMKVLEVGPGMGFFTLTIVKLVGKSGRVYCVDVQEKMLASLRKRITKANVADRVELRGCTDTSLRIDDLAGTIDFVLAFAVVHEIPAQENFFRELFGALKSGGSVLMAEPERRVPGEKFRESLLAAKSAGFNAVEIPDIERNHSVLLVKEGKNPASV